MRSEGSVLLRRALSATSSPPVLCVDSKYFFTGGNMQVTLNIISFGKTAYSL
jgi:hypothetical protein